MRPEDFEQVDALLREDHKRADEADVVKRLRADGDMYFEQFTLAPDSGGLDGDRPLIGAYVSIAKMRAPVGWLCIGPIGVLPRLPIEGEWREISSQGREFIAARIVAAYVQISSVSSRGWARRRVLGTGLPAIVAIGNASLFAKCGFSLDRAANLTSPYALENTLIARPGDDIPEETLEFPAAIAESFKISRPIS